MARRKPTAEIHEVSIEAMSHEGRGIAHINGKIVFVFGALEGERVRIQLRQRRRKFDQASVVEVLERSSRRIEPRCAAFEVCGGCSLQHQSGDDQVKFKQQSLLAMLDHAGIDYQQVIPALRGPGWEYRAKARLGVKHVPKKNRVLVGFRERNSPFIADMTRCEVLIPEVGQRLDVLSEMIGNLEACARIPQIEVAADASHVQLVFRHLDPLSDHDREILRDFGRIHGLMIQLQSGGPETVQSLYPEQQQLLLEPTAQNSPQIGFSALDFIQVNTVINQQMVAQALRLLELQPGERVLDLFCGLGNFTLPMAAGSGHVTGVEGDAAMVKRAAESARNNGIDNTEYHVADLSQPNSAATWMRAKYDKILLDPPRSGALEIAQNIRQFKAGRIVYVSCQPSSLVRDAAIICEQGYRLTHIGVMDMFPQTAHIESMAVFSSN